MSRAEKSATNNTNDANAKRNTRRHTF